MPVSLMSTSTKFVNACLSLDAQHALKIVMEPPSGVYLIALYRKLLQELRGSGNLKTF